MNESPPAIIDLATETVRAPERNGHHTERTESRNGYHPVIAPTRPLDQETLRQVAWDIGEQRPADHYLPSENHVGLVSVHPYQGCLHWRIRQDWIDEQIRRRGPAWQNCTLVARIYDVSFIEFNGLNAHHMFDVNLSAIAGHCFFNLARPGTWQLAEVGFRLRNGEFVPAARSHIVPFPSDSVSSRHSHAGLLVDESGAVKEVGNLWEQERVLLEHRKPKIERPLRIAALAFESLATGQQGPLARFVSELATGKANQGHEVHLFVPATADFKGDRSVNNVVYHPLEVSREGGPLDVALRYARAAEEGMRTIGDFDLIHLHEWMTGLAAWIGTRPTVLSLTSLEATRRNGKPPSELSKEIQQAEAALAHSVGCILTPDWLRDRAVSEFGLDASQVHPFPMEARLPNQWEAAIDVGKVKMEIGLGVYDRPVVFVGPLEHGSGVDILVEALPTLLQRAPQLRVVCAGYGSMMAPLAHRASQLGVGHALRLLGDVPRSRLVGILRAGEGLILPSRHRVEWDDAVVDLARLAGKPVITTVAGPAHLVQHEQTGLVTYDNPGSMVWALDRLLHDPQHAEEMGRRGKRNDGAAAVDWFGVVRLYLDLCAASFPELRGTDARTS
jgi:glycosyltransferase involved in cell wall biosynthesis